MKNVNKNQAKHSAIKDEYSNPDASDNKQPQNYDEDDQGGYN